MTEDQGLYNKPSAAVYPGALAVGTLPQYNTIQYTLQPNYEVFKTHFNAFLSPRPEGSNWSTHSLLGLLKLH